MVYKETLVCIFTMASKLGNLLACMENRLNNNIQAQFNAEPTLKKDQPEQPEVDTPEPDLEWKCLAHSKEDEYHVIYHNSMENFAKKLGTHGSAKRFMRYDTEWGKFDDGTDNITIKGIKNENGKIIRKVNSPTYFKGKDILFVASFH